MSIKPTGIRFLVDNALYNYVLDEPDVAKIIKDYQEGKLRPVIGGISLNYKTFAAVHWAIKVDTIKAIHSFDVDQALAQVQNQIGELPGQAWRGSGLN